MKLKKILATILIINLIFNIIIPITLLGNDIEVQNESTIIDNENIIEANENIIEANEKSDDNRNVDKYEEIDEIIETVEKIDDNELQSKEEYEELEIKNKVNIPTVEQNIQESIMLTNEIKEEAISSSQTLEDGIYKISTTLNEKLVLDVDGGYTKNFANIQLYNDVNVEQQKFIVSYLKEGYYTITAFHSEKSLDVAGGGKNPGTNVQQYASNYTDSQKWIIKETEDGYYSIISKCNGLYIDVSGGNASPGANIQVYTKNNTKSQKFKFEKIETLNRKQTLEDGIYKISTALNKNLVLDVYGGQRNNYANIQLYADSNVNQQKFIVNYVGNGYYTITALHSDKSLDVAGGGKKPGTNVQQYASNDTNSQKWIIKETEDGYFNIISKCNGLYLDVAGGEAKYGTNIQVYTGNNTLSQKFIFDEIESLNREQTLENGIYKISTALNERLVLDVYGGQKNNYANVQLYADVNENQQKFIVTYVGDGYYTISVLHSDKSLDVAGGGKNPGANVQQYEKNDTNSQKWIIREVQDGYYNIISKCNGLYIDVSGGKAEYGTNIQMYIGNNTMAQKFKFEKTKANYIYNGIDVSTFNGEIDWNLVQQTQDFAIIRVGYRGYLRPNIVMDDKFIQNIKGAQSVGLACGVYFFSQAITEAEAIEEANWVANAISGYPITYPVVLDSEWSNTNHSGRADYLTTQERTKVAKAFLETIRNRGYKSMLYANPDWLYNHLDMSQLSSYDLWLAHYTGGINIPSYYSGNYTMWQYTSEGNVNGVSGNVDRNICYKQY